MYNHYQYCEMLARQLKAVSHSNQRSKYFEATEQMELEELEQNISNVSGTILVAIDPKYSQFAFRSDSLIEKPTYSIVIAKQTKSTDARTVTASQNHCKQICDQIISKILNDAIDFTDNTDKIDASSFIIEGFGPIAGVFYGVMLSFSLAQGKEFMINPQYWNE